MQFAEDEMWGAVVDCDDNYNGRFLYAVKTVGVYCRPSCKSRTPLRKNVCYFETQENAQNAGFRPCKRCRPDLTDYAPVLEIARQTKELIDGYYCRRERLIREMKQLGVTTNHLAVIFKQQYGVPPIQYLNRLRSEQAKNMLAETDMSIIDIAGDIGFSSLPAFYSFFKRQTGTTPKKYRGGL
ncbi:bifunctional transcriptional activator/DNA repair enzyme AdaA [Desulfosporosinus shakirovi]|uniref:bifunctional transcriptional activator/DNA repair enzyme AdaA n=1 Tax=Desulfosporosinus shakirovi TaxID=2885154 RepID=UPI001E39B6F1|nr:Ada metal-binding domain-containing protein [Desulfosporosinus sp. SRJS8]MCB8817674.1 helix-turn-helix domain-containing protein [Desulfosporosinus sp. SRJS8]